jgi:hypothetical protein
MRIVNLDQVARATHAGEGIELQVAGGVSLRVLPERGLDLGPATFAGRPLAWISAVGESRRVHGDWDRSWTGGLLTTCGLDNVGVPSEGAPQHGTYTYLRAHDVQVERSGDGIEVRATIDDALALGRHLRVERTIWTSVGEGLVRLRDVTTNLGGDEEPAPVLYHCNLGWPLWAEGSELEVDSSEVVPRDEDAAAGLDRWNRPPEPDLRAPELVFEHLDATRAVVRGGGLELELSFDLPRLWQWLHPALHVLALEPANCSVLGRAHDRAEGRLPTLAPGASRESGVEFRVRTL